MGAAIKSRRPHVVGTQQGYCSQLALKSILHLLGYVSGYPLAPRCFMVFQEPGGHLVETRAGLTLIDIGSHIDGSGKVPLFQELDYIRRAWDQSGMDCDPYFGDGVAAPGVRASARSTLRLCKAGQVQRRSGLGGPHK